MAVIDHIEHGTIAFPSGSASHTEALTTTLTDLTKSFLIYSYSMDQDRPGRQFWAGEIQDVNTLAWTRYQTGSAVTGYYSVVEFSSGVTVQHVEDTSLPASALIPLGWSASVTSDTSESGFLTTTWAASDGVLKGQWLMSRYVDHDIIEFSQWEADSGCNPVRCQVVVYDDTADARQVPGTYQYFDTTANGTLNLRDTVDRTRTWLMGNCHHDWGGGGSHKNPNSASMQYDFTDDDTAAYTRRGTQDASGHLWMSAFEFLDGTTVQEITIPFTTSQTEQTGTISPALSATTDAIVVPSGSFHTMGSSAYSGADNFGSCMFGTRITATNTVTATRSVTETSAAELTCYVIDFSGAT